MKAIEISIGRGGIIMTMEGETLKVMEEETSVTAEVLGSLTEEMITGGLINNLREGSMMT
jgi:hypothetical protein